MGRWTNNRTSQDELRELLWIADSTHGLFENASLNQQFALKSYVGLSRLRDRSVEDGTELVDVKTSTRVTLTPDSEFEVTTPATSGATTDFLTAQFGRYQPGYPALAAMGFRLGARPTGDGRIEWVYGSTRTSIGSGDRFLFGSDKGSDYIAFDRGDVRQFEKPQSEWNLDTLDGTGPSSANPSGLKLDVLRGNVFRVLFTWYGYGDTFWIVMVPDENGIQRDIPVHVFSPSGSTSLQVPDAPVGVSVDNGTSGEALTGYVAGRGFGTIGGAVFNEAVRTIPEERTDVSIASGAWTPIIALRRKAQTSYGTVAVRPSGVQIISTNNEIRFGLFSGGLVGDGTFASAPTDGDSGETTLEWNNTATTITDLGVPVARRGVLGGSGGNVGGGEIGGLRNSIPDRDPLLLAAKGVGATATVSAILTMAEDW